MIKAVVFDVDGVLIDSFEANLKFFQRLMKITGYPPVTRKSYKTMFHLNMMEVIRLLTQSKSEEEIKKIWLLGKRRVGELYPNELITIPRRLEDVIKTLFKKYSLGIVTQRIRGGVFRLPELMKIEKYFKTAVYFEDTKKHKPDPEPLLLAIKRMMVGSEESVYVGDAESDVAAARAAKMKVIGYAKKGLNGVDKYTQLFSKLPELIELLN